MGVIVRVTVVVEVVTIRAVEVMVVMVVDDQEAAHRVKRSSQEEDHKGKEVTDEGISELRTLPEPVAGAGRVKVKRFNQSGNQWAILIPPDVILVSFILFPWPWFLENEPFQQLSCCFKPEG